MALTLRIVSGERLTRRVSDTIEGSGGDGGSSLEGVGRWNALVLASARTQREQCSRRRCINIARRIGWEGFTAEFVLILVIFDRRCSSTRNLEDQ